MVVNNLYIFIFKCDMDPTSSSYNMSGASKSKLRDSASATGSLQATKDCTSCLTSGRSILDYCKPCRVKWTEERSRAADEMERNERERTVQLLAPTDTDHKAASSDTQTSSKFSPRLGDEFKPLTIRHAKQDPSASKVGLEEVWVRPELLQETVIYDISSMTVRMYERRAVQ